jgi:beta-galactosidase
LKSNFNLLARFMIVGTCAALCVAQLSAADSPREHLSLDANWKFHLGDDWSNALNLAKAGASTGAASDKFSDKGWRAIDLPHDWAVELPFDKAADESHGFKAVGPGFPGNSIGWYRRTFDLPTADADKRIWLTFDGVFRDATVWINGWLVRRHEGGYYPFREDITDVVKFGGKNLITVRVDASKLEGWFYEGAGIYRHVWLDKTAPVAIAPEGIFVRSEFAGNTPTGEAAVNIEVTLLNAQANAATATVTCAIIPPISRESLGTFSKSETLESGSKLAVNLGSKLMVPLLWSPESPNLYKLVTTVSVDGKVVDRKETEFGVRTVAFDKDRGFLLNGKPYVLKGTCNHQDHAGVGVALPDALQSFRIARLKEFGCNAYRTSHNPPTPELLDACDRLGMIVMDEGRLLGSDSENLRKWDDQIRRDRNHPSVCIWSVANEEFSVQSTPQGGNAARTMQNYVKRLDPTRPVTYAAPQGNTFAGINGVIEVRGWNYNVGTDMDKYHAEHPDQPNVGTEQASTTTTRGIYADDKERGYVRAYDDRGVQTSERWWSYFADRPWLSGGFVWTGFDYRGEPTPYSWPCISSHFGILDTCGFPKDNFYYYQSWWTTDTVLHLVPHWNWQGREGQEIRVDALSNCKEVELFLNGKSLGKQAMKPNSKLTWKVKYAPGTLSAKGFDATGKVIAEKKVETTGQPVVVKLTRDLTGLSNSVKADGEDIAIFTVSAVDSQGREVSTAQNKVNFNLEGAGKIIGVGNGDPSCHEADVFLPPEMRTVPINGWRWKLGDLPTKVGESSPVLGAGLDESDWNAIKTKTDAAISDMPLQEKQTAVYRAHVKLTTEDLDTPGVRIQFTGCDDNGWYFVNGHLVGESHNWQEQPSFDIKPYLHPGDNIIAVGVRNDSGVGGLNPNVNLEISAKSFSTPWSRSLFNGLAQIIVQSEKTPGVIKLTASGDGLSLATATVQTQAAAP